MQVTAVSHICSKPVRQLLLAVFLLLWVISTPRAQDGYVVTEVSFSGNEALSDGQLSEQIAMHGTGGLLGLFSGGEDFIYSRDALEADMERLTRYYQRQGFLNVDIRQPILDVNEGDQQAKVTFVIVEGTPVVVDTIVLESEPRSDTASGRDSMSETDSLLQVVRGRLQLSSGVRFRDRLVEQDRRRLTDFFADHGYPYVRSTPRLDVDTSAMTVGITWLVNPGPLSAFGEVTVSGNKNVPTDIILKQLAFKGGQRYQQGLLSRTQDWIYGLGAFRVVTVTATIDSSMSDRVPVHIQVDEAPRLSTEFGVGYGREEEFRAHNKTRLIGFLGEVRRLELMVRHSALEPYHVDISWTQPAFLTPHTSASISPFIRRQTEPGYTVNRYGGDIEIRHQFNRDLDASARYVFEQVELDRGSIARAELTTSEFEGFYSKSSVIFGATRDDSRPLFSPNSGSRLIATWKLSGLDLGSKYHFTSVLLEARHYYAVMGVVIASRLKTGAIESFDPSEFVPVEDRFFAGGSQSVRGWPRAELGPMSDTRPLGGNGLLEMAVELRYPLFWNFSGAVFMDAGNVWREMRQVALGDLRYSPGLGLRYATPIGPVRLDAARPVWDTESTWQFHISVGEAF